MLCYAVLCYARCPHVLACVAPLPDAAADAAGWMAAGCAECGATGENMLCLECHAVLCGRYVKGHAAKHAAAHPGGHRLVVGMADLSCWCS